MKGALLLLLVFSLIWSQPIVGEADSLTYEKNKIIYMGNVRISRGNAVLTANKVTIHLDENKKAKLAEAEGNVRYVEGNRRGSADKMVYNIREETITLIGRAKVEDGPNFVEGEEIVYYRKENRALAVGRGSKVRTFYVEEEDEKNRASRKP